MTDTPALKVKRSCPVERRDMQGGVSDADEDLGSRSNPGIGSLGASHPS